MNWTLEVVVLPVSDIDRSIAFYRDRLGFHLDHTARLGLRGGVGDLTPRARSCWIRDARLGGLTARVRLRGLSASRPRV